MIRKTVSLAGLGLLLGLLCAFPGRADDDASSVFTFGNGLENKGFYDLAAEQYLALARDEKASEQDRAEAASRLAACYRKAAGAAEKPEVKDDFLLKASDQLAALRNTFKNPFHASKALFELGLINQQRAFDRDKQLKATQDQKLQSKLKVEASQFFIQAARVFAEVSGRLEPMLKEPPERNRPPPFPTEILEQFLLARGSLGWTHYYCGVLFSRDPADQDKARKEYHEAQKVLEAFVKEYPSYIVTLWARCGLGLAYRGLQDFPKAVEQFEYVRRYRRIRASGLGGRAYVWLIETYRLNRQYSEGLRVVDLFLQREAQFGPKTDIEPVKLEQAKIYAERAQGFENDHKIAEALEDYKQAFSITGDIIKAGGDDQSEACRLRIEWAQGILAATEDK